MLLIAQTTTDLPFTCPGDVVEEVARELSPELSDSESTANFEAYMVDAYERCAVPNRRSWFFQPILLASVAISLGCFVHVFLSDVLYELIHM